MKKRIFDILISLLLAGILAALLDAASVWNGKSLSAVKFAALYGGLFLAVWLLVKPAVKKWSAVILGTAAVLALAAIPVWRSVSQGLVYNSPDQGKARLYGDQTVMLLAPHQDDDINVLGGVIEEYVKYGSQVYIVFSTNGDYSGLAETRFREALTAAERMGVPAEQVIFLGYGDQYAQDGPHLYNAEPGEVVTSSFGRTETYGTGAAKVYREGRAYTRENFLADIEAVILAYRPEVLYCVDYDYNIDHRALSLSFETVMGKLLKEQPDYRPQVFKGYAYDTAWEAVKDFYEENLLATQNVFAPPYEEKPEVYRWEERTRLPVHGEGLSRSAFSGGQYEALSAYFSQGATMNGARIFNSDKVFWQRDTNSLLHQAAVTVSSGNASLLNDFLLLDDRDLLTNDMPVDGVWVPADDEKQMEAVFSQSQNVMEIWLYDHPDTARNVLNAEIRFDDGTVLETGPLDPGGAATRFPVEKQNVSSFTVTLTQWEGEAGLTEVEAYGQREPVRPFLKLMDETGNFAYDYWIKADGEQLFSLYKGGDVGEVAYALTCDGEDCTAEWEGELIRIRCPQGKSCVVTVTSADGTLSDSVFIRNPGPLEREYIGFWLRLEETALKACDEKRLHERTFVCRLWQKCSNALDRILN